MARWLHAWGWVALWLLLVGRGSHAFPIGLFSALATAVLLVPGIYLPLVLMRREDAPDLSGELSAPLAAALAGLVFSAVVLGTASLFGFWDQRPRGATLVGLVVAVIALHVLAAVCIGFAERWLWPEDDD